MDIYKKTKTIFKIGEKMGKILNKQMYSKIFIIYKGKKYPALMKIKDIADSVERYKRNG